MLLLIVVWRQFHCCALSFFYVCLVWFCANFL